MNLIASQNAQLPWKLWADVSANETTLDSEAGLKVPPAIPAQGEISSGVFRPKADQNAALVRFFTAGGDNETCDWEVVGYPAVYPAAFGRGYVLAKGRVVFGTKTTGAVLYNPIDGSVVSSTTWREPDTLYQAGGTNTFAPYSPLEILSYGGFDTDNRSGLLYLSLKTWAYYAIRLTALPSGPDQTIVGILPFTE